MRVLYSAEHSVAMGQMMGCNWFKCVVYHRLKEMKRLAINVIVFLTYPHLCLAMASLGQACQVSYYI